MSKNINYNIKVGVIGDAQLQKFQRTVDKINKSTAKADLSPLRIFLLMVRRGDCDGQLQHAPTVAVCDQRAIFLR